MRLNLFILGISTALVLGCSNLQKKPLEVASASPSATSQVSVSPATPMGMKVDDEMHKLTCSRDQEIRTIKWESSSPKGCKLFYSNHSSKDAVAWSHVGNTHCEQVRDRIKGNLETAGFKCSAGQGSQSTTSAPNVPTTGTKADTNKDTK